MRKFENIGRIKVFIKDPNKKNVFKIIKELFVLFFVKKEIPFYYFKYIYKKNVENYLDYLSTKEVVKMGYSRILHKAEYNSIIENKLCFSLFMENTSIKTPKLVAYNFGVNFFIDGDVELVTDKQSVIAFFQKVFLKIDKEALFFRPLSDYGGKGCFKITKQNYKEELEEKYKALLNGDYVHTEIIEQHERISKIHNKSVCTLRLVSLITHDNKIEIIGGFMRFGVGNSVVDNSSSGGFLVGINLKDGSLKNKGHFMLDYGGGEIYKHPDSDFEFFGFEIPFFEEACNEVVNAVKLIPERFVGWDVAITKDGPTIIEGNCTPHVPSLDIAYGGLLKNHHVKNLINELK